MARGRRAEAGIDVEDPAEAANEQAAGRHERDGHRDLGDDQRRAQPASAAVGGDGAARVTQRRSHVTARA